MKKNISNLPQELQEACRFFSVNEKKIPLIKDWNNPANQKTLNEIDGLAGFDICGHGVEGRTDYVFLDFDHVLDDNGEFVTRTASDNVLFLLAKFPNIYIERSISGHGLHAFVIPTETFSDTITNDKFGVLHLDDSKDKGAPKLEIFYKSKGRYCLVTGNLYEKGKEIPQGEAVDVFLNNLLEEIKTKGGLTAQNTPARNSEENLFAPARADSVGNYDPPEYTRDLAIELFKAINAADLPNTEWLPCISALKGCGIHKEQARDLCQNSTRYDAKDFDKQWEYVANYDVTTLIGKATQYSIPFDYKSFKRQWYNENPQFSTLKRSRAEQATDLNAELLEVNKEIESFEEEKQKALEELKNVETFDIDTVFSEKVITCLAYADAYDKHLFSAFKIDVQKYRKDHADKGVRLPDLATVVVEKREEIKKLERALYARRASIQGKINNAQFQRRYAEISNVSIPDGYIFTENGLEKLTTGKSVLVCRSPIIISRMVYNVEDETVKVILAYLASNGKWKKIQATGAEIIANNKKIVDLAKFNFPVTSGNAIQIVDYFDAFKHANFPNIPKTYQVGKCGWKTLNGKDYFIDPRRENFIENDEGKKFPLVVGDSQFSKSLKAVGSFEDWKKAYSLAKSSPVARLMVAVAIAPPLLNILGERNFWVHICADTRAGKTTALLLGASTFGSEKVIRSFDATKNGLTGAAADVNDYAFLLDEKQVADHKMQENFNQLVYALGNGVGRTRLNKDATLKNVEEWRTIVLTTGETTLIEDNATGGVYTRLMQINAPAVILAPETCKEIRMIVKNNYGLIFSRVLEKIEELGTEDLREMFNEFSDHLQQTHPELLIEYSRYMAVITLADFLIQECVCDADEAIGDALQNTKEVMSLIPTKEEVDDTPREMTAICNFIAQNQRSFLGTTSDTDISKIPSLFGKIEKEFTYITVSAVKKACVDAGFDYKKLTKDLIACNFFVPADKPEKGRSKPLDTVKTRIGEINARCFRIRTSALRNESWCVPQFS